MTDPDLLPLSGLQHWIYCDRQAALIHIARAWTESRTTAEGRLLHENVDHPGRRSRRDVHMAHALPLRSDRLGIVGQADLVELHSDLAAPRRVRPYPVEFKRGKVKQQHADQVQLCAQAYCLEEQFGVEISEGALYYGESDQRMVVAFDRDLRHATETAALDFRRQVCSGILPHARYAPRKCKGCSLFADCQPTRPGDGHHATRYLDSLFEEARR